MRVTWIIDSLGPGGAEALVPRFAAAAGQRADLEVVTLRRPAVEPHADALVATGASLVSVRADSLRDAMGFARLVRHLRDRRPDVVHCHLDYATIWGSMAVSFVGRPPLLATLHEMPREREDSLRSRLLQTLACGLLRRRAERVIAVSAATGRAHVERRLLPGSLLRVVHNAAPALPAMTDSRKRSEARRRLDLPERAPVLLAVGVLRAAKGFADAVRALAQVHLRFPDATLVVVGSGPERESLRALAARHAHGTRCIFLGHRDDLDAIYPAADLLVHPSHRDALPTVVLEAMAHGVPVVATDVDGIQEALGPGGGRLVRAGDVAGLAAACCEVLGQPDLADALRTSGRRRASELQPRLWVERVMTVYEEAVARRAARRAPGVARGRA